MNKNKIAAFLFVCVLFCTSLTYAQTSKIVEEERVKPTFVQRLKSNQCGYDKPLRIAGFVTNPPFGWVDIVSVHEILKNNGFSFKLLEEVAQEENIKIQNDGYLSYQEAVAAVKSDKADILLGIYYDPQLLDGLELVFPSYISNPFIVLFKKGSEREVKTFNDLAGLKGVVRQEELIYPLIFNSLPNNVQMTQVSGARNAFTGLMDGTYDYMLTSLYAGEAEIRHFKLLDDIVISQTALTQPELFFAFGKNSICLSLKDKISEKIKKLKAEQSTIQKKIIAEIDAWGKRFEEDASLLETLQTKQPETSQSPDTQKETDV